MLPNLHYEKPDLESDMVKPMAFPNQSLPYNYLASSRRFEELLYAIFYIKIQNRLIGDFDDINLMSGVRDKGRDCNLIRGGYSYGLIQCKQYSSNYNKNQFGSEIVRFVLYSLLDDRLIADYCDFTYYIAVSNGFSDDCSSFIDNFSHNISIENNLNEWIDKNLEMPTLKVLKDDFDYQSFKNIISKIKVKKIIPQDLDSDLHLNGFSHLISSFFEVKTVTDNSIIKDLINELKTQGGASNPEKLLEQLDLGSARLQSEKNTFQNIQNIHIDRFETQALYSWINDEPVRDEDQILKNICLLAGEAGYGKTVIMKDLYNLCKDNGIAVLGLKADKLYSDSIKELQEKLGFDLPVFNTIKECKIHFKKVVILIDQIDALSQSMASDRSFIELYRTFIQYFSSDEQVKFIISVRNSDLKYDPSLKIYEDVKTISVSLLSHGEVKNLLQEMNIDQSMLSQKLLEILRVPNHLNIFSQIVSNNKIFRANDVLDLYLELWRQKVLQISNTTQSQRKKIKNLIYMLAQNMFELQRISLSVLQYEDFENELYFLESQMLIKIDNRQLQFFHQTFYDFVFAKQFVENGNNLCKYIKNADQSIHIRAAVKMIVNYVRDFNDKDYIKAINEVYFDENILFHIKHLLLVTIAEQQDPMKDEYELIKKMVNDSYHWQTVFFDHATPIVWLRFDLENNLLKILKSGFTSNHISEDLLSAHREKARKAAESFLSKAIAENDGKAWAVLEKIDDDNLKLCTLLSVTDWHESNAVAYSFFEQVNDLKQQNSFDYFIILERIAEKNPNYVFSIIKNILPINFKENSTRHELLESEVLKTLAKKIPILLFNYIFGLLSLDINDKDLEKFPGIKIDYRFKYIELEDDESLNGSEFFFQLLAVCLNNIAENYSEYFINFFNDKKSTASYAVMRLLIHTLEKYFEKFGDQIYELFLVFNDKDMLTYNDDLEQDLRVLLEKAFEQFNNKQKEKVISIIRNYKSNNEIRIWTNSETNKKSYHSNWGLSKYYLLQRIPKNIIEKNLKHEFLQLERKFGILKKEENRSRKIMAGIVHSPIEFERCQRMNIKQWLKAFKRYSTERNPFEGDHLKGGLEELARAFKSTVIAEADSNKLIIITKALKDPDIPLRFVIYGLSGWADSGADIKLIISIVKQLLEKDLGFDKSTFLHVVTAIISREKEIDIEFVNYLVKEAITFQDGIKNAFEIPEGSEISIHGLVGKAINTDYGTATVALTKISDKRYSNLIFTTLKTIFDNGPRESRAAIFYRFAYLNNLDKAQSKLLYTHLLKKEKDLYVLATSIWSFQYMRSMCLNESLIAYEKLIDSELMGKDDCHSLFLSLYGLYLNGNEKLKTVLLDLFIKQKKFVSTFIREILINYYSVENTVEKNNYLLQFILEIADEESAEEMNWSFLNAEHVKLGDVYNYFKKFVQSDNFKFTDYFVDYLNIQLTAYPYQSIELFQLAMINNRTDKVYSYRIEEKCIKFIVSSYNLLHHQSEENRLLKISILKSFDELLINYRFTKSTDKILDELL